MGRAENICASAKRDIADMCQSSGDLHELVATRLPNLQEGALAPMQVPPVLALTSAAACSRGNRLLLCRQLRGRQKLLNYAHGMSWLACAGAFGCEICVSRRGVAHVSITECWLEVPKIMRMECPGWHELAPLAVKLGIKTWGSPCEHHRVLAGGANKPCALRGPALL